MSSELKNGKEKEKLSRRLRIGIIGPLGSGKTTVAKLLNERWPQSEYIEERYGENPFLAAFYENPQEFSFKSQVWFLEKKVGQLSGLKGEKTEIVDPSLEMDRLYAQTQNSMGWMNLNEWELYQNLFNALVIEKNITRPDYYLVMNVPEEVLLSRVKERIAKGGRDFERWILERYPEYLVKLSENVKLWRLENNKLPIFEMDTGYDNCSKEERRQELLSRIESHIAVWQSQNTLGADKARLIAPNYPRLNVRTYDPVPGSGYLTR